MDIRNPDVMNINDRNISLFVADENDPSIRVSNDAIKSIIEDNDGKIWISNDSPYLDCYNYDTDKFTHHLVDVPKITERENTSLFINIDKSDNIWIYTRTLGLHVWDRKKDTFSEFKLYDEDYKQKNLSNIQVLFFDENDQLWIGTNGNGLFIYNIENEDYEHYLKSITDQSNLNSNVIYSIYKDNSGVFWVGTYLSGINKYLTNKSYWGLHTANPYTNNALSANKVTNFCEGQDGNIWISTDGGGLNKWDRRNNTFTNITKEEGLSVNAAISLYYDNDNRIWIGTYNGGLNIFDTRTETIEKIYNNPSDTTSISSNSPWDFAKDKQGNMWIATVNSGLNLLKKNSDDFVNYTITNSSYQGPAQITSYSLTHIYVDSRNWLWIGTESGLDMVDLNRVDFSDNKPELVFNHFKVSDTENSISNERISYITEDKNGTIWIGTKGAGINKLDPETMHFTVYNASDGLAHNIVNGILFDKNENLWISTNNGISFFDRKEKQFHNFNASDGLQSNLFYKTACLKTSDGMMIFGGINGFNAFYPSDIRISAPQLKTTITGFDLFGKPVKAGDSIKGRAILNKPVYETDKIQLGYEENNISFKFSVLNYSAPEKVIYSYKLDGFDDEWLSTESDYRIATYTNLNPGTYTFQVRAKNQGYEWTDNSAEIIIDIKPPFWQTLWFLISAVFIVLFLAFMFYHIRVSALKKQKLLLENAVDKKTSELKLTVNQLVETQNTKDKLFSIIAHDLINPLNSIMGLSEVLLEDNETANQSEIIKNINQSSNELYDLLENLLQWSRSERGMLNYLPEKVYIKKEVEKIISLLSLTANRKHIEIDMQVPANECTVKADQRLLNTIIRNLVSNAIKFTPEYGKIIIKTERQESQYIVSIIDNGIGISQENLERVFEKENSMSTSGTNNEKGTGLGLVLVKELVEKQNGKLFVHSEVGKGSTFSFTLQAW
jgi:signal transduction histidine kinase/ligand-binding sensor domain-containing protein